MMSLPASASGSSVTTGANLVEAANAPFGSNAALASFEHLAASGAGVVALIPFFWQSHESDAKLVRGNALPNERLQDGILQAHKSGLEVLVKPHIWVPDRWAGSITFSLESDWQAWFAAYEAALTDCADIAAKAGAQTFCVGTELKQASERPEWTKVIARIRSVFPGRLTYVAHNAAEARQVGFWDQLDIVAMSSYPALGSPSDRAGWRRAIGNEARALRLLADRHGKPAWLGEIGIRSAVDATYKPWESAEERDALPDMAVQRDVLQMWLEIADEQKIDTALVWRWLSDPNGGGPRDTDFTIQNKPAQDLLAAR
ncbi:glycoside hydrolase family 113 [Qipengyuania qiaonensis]|nr:hypothetical protein [Qipengyuania qiaonensis]